MRNVHSFVYVWTGFKSGEHAHRCCYNWWMGPSGIAEWWTFSSERYHRHKGSAVSSSHWPSGEILIIIALEMSTVQLTKSESSEVNLQNVNVLVLVSVTARPIIKLSHFCLPQKFEFLLFITTFHLLFVMVLFRLYSVKNVMRSALEKQKSLTAGRGSLMFQRWSTCSSKKIAKVFDFKLNFRYVYL